MRHRQGKGVIGICQHLHGYHKSAEIVDEAGPWSGDPLPWKLSELVQDAGALRSGSGLFA